MHLRNTCWPCAELEEVQRWVGRSKNTVLGSAQSSSKTKQGPNAGVYAPNMQPMYRFQASIILPQPLKYSWLATPDQVEEGITL